MKHALYCATKALLTVLLVLWWPWCSPRPVCLAAESSPVSIIFTRQGDNPPSTSIAQAGSIFDITGATWRSKYPVAPPGTYVALCQGGAGVAGAWADPQGFVGLMVPCPATGSCSLSYSSKQSMSIARSSIHRLSGQNGEAQPAAARSDYFLFLAYEGLGGSGEMRSWNLETGTERGRYIWNHPSGPIFRPWVVPYQSGSTYYIFHDVKTAAGYRLVTRVSATHSFVYADVVRTAPHNPVAYTIGGLIHAYYTRPYTTATAVGKETYVAEGCRPMSGNSCLMKGPPNLSNLTLACTPTGHMLLAGEEDGQVYVYGGSLMRRSVTGQRPAAYSPWNRLTISQMRISQNAVVVSISQNE